MSLYGYFSAVRVSDQASAIAISFWDLIITVRNNSTGYCKASYGRCVSHSRRS